MLTNRTFLFFVFPQEMSETFKWGCEHALDHFLVPHQQVLSLKKMEVFFTTTELVKLNKDLQQAHRGCQAWNSAENPYHSCYPTFWSTCRSGWNVALFCVLNEVISGLSIGIHGPGHSSFRFRFHVSKLHQPEHSLCQTRTHHDPSWNLKQSRFPMFFLFHLDPQVSDAYQAVDDYQKQTDAQLGRIIFLLVAFDRSLF